MTWQTEIVESAGALVLAMLSLLLVNVTRKVNTVKAQVTNNHGSSAKDAIDRTEQKTDEQTALLRELRRDIGGVRQDLRQLHQTDISDRERAQADHKLIWEAINDMKGK